MTTTHPLLDTSWSIQHIPHGNRSKLLETLLTRPTTNPTILQQLKDLSNECQQYLSTRGPIYKDDLNDETERTGQLRECTITQFCDFDGVTIRGLSIETRYQKTTFRVCILARPALDGESCPVGVMLCKASSSHVKDIKAWLEDRFGVPSAMSLQMPSQVILRMCSGFLGNMDESLVSVGADADALRQATLKHVVGSLKMTITFSVGMGIAPQLKTMEFDVPAETVGVLLNKGRERVQTESVPGYGFLDEFVKVLHEKTGLILPLTGNVVERQSLSTNLEDSMADTEQIDQEPPLKVTKITCAAFALSVDGRMKLASKPLEDAEAIGYDESMVRQIYSLLIRGVCDEAERRGKDEQ